jgi:hypothetical protein
LPEKKRKSNGVEISNPFGQKKRPLNGRLGGRHPFRWREQALCPFAARNLPPITGKVPWTFWCVRSLGIFHTFGVGNCLKIS